MKEIIAVINNEVLQVAALSWLIAQLLKILLTLITERKFDISRLTGSGGMPSSHSSFSVSLAVAIGYQSGFTSNVFAVAAAFSIIVMYDASGIRRNAGKQAAILNRFLEKEGVEERLKELLGHTPLQVFAGAFLGILIAVLRFGI